MTTALAGAAPIDYNESSLTRPASPQEVSNLVLFLASESPASRLGQSSWLMAAPQPEEYTTCEVRRPPPNARITT
ncbi:hypothetical protein ACFVYC_14630 [Pseudarthrobacter sp. NPDC058329]|uniref:hypothetical protein n=1 Tax=Pseudarthrobacter sp. NPDC058329 TaxID=3346448 RepID=UPI0036DEB608